MLLLLCNVVAPKHSHGERRLAVGNDLPRLAPIEEIDAATDLTRLGRKRPFLSISEVGARPRKIRENQASAAIGRRSKSRARIAIAFVAGFALAIVALRFVPALLASQPPEHPRTATSPTRLPGRD